MNASNFSLFVIRFRESTISTGFRISVDSFYWRFSPYPRWSWVLLGWEINNGSKKSAYDITKLSTKTKFILKYLKSFISTFSNSSGFVCFFQSIRYALILNAALCENLGFTQNRSVLFSPVTNKLNASTLNPAKYLPLSIHMGHFETQTNYVCGNIVNLDPFFMCILSYAMLRFFPSVSTVCLLCDWNCLWSGFQFQSHCVCVFACNTNECHELWYKHGYSKYCNNKLSYNIANDNSANERIGVGIFTFYPMYRL